MKVDVVKRIDKATLNCNVGSRPRPHDIFKKC